MFEVDVKNVTKRKKKKKQWSLSFSLGYKTVGVGWGGGWVQRYNKQDGIHCQRPTPPPPPRHFLYLT